jgi:hypothetical protein
LCPGQTPGCSTKPGRETALRFSLGSSASGCMRSRKLSVSNGWMRSCSRLPSPSPSTLFFLTLSKRAIRQRGDRHVHKSCIGDITIEISYAGRKNGLDTLKRERQDQSGTIGAACMGYRRVPLVRLRGQRVRVRTETPKKHFRDASAEPQIPRLYLMTGESAIEVSPSRKHRNMSAR